MTLPRYLNQVFQSYNGIWSVWYIVKLLQNGVDLRNVFLYISIDKLTALSIGNFFFWAFKIINELQFNQLFKGLLIAPLVQHSNVFGRSFELSLYTLSGERSALEVQHTSVQCGAGQEVGGQEPWDVCFHDNQVWVLMACQSRPLHVYSCTPSEAGTLQVLSHTSIIVKYEESHNN